MSAELPKGARQLTPDEAVEAIITGDHAHTQMGNIGLDAALIEGIRRGWFQVARLADGQLSFTRTEVDR